VTLDTTEQNLDPNELDPHSKRICTLRAALHKLDPAAAPKPIEPRPPLPSGDRPQAAALGHHHV
jgi:hypothetical protein